MRLLPSHRRQRAKPGRAFVRELICGHHRERLPLEGGLPPSLPGKLQGLIVASLALGVVDSVALAYRPDLMSLPCARPCLRLRPGRKRSIVFLQGTGFC